MNKVLVTGDNGYIGSVMAPLLINEGYEVIGLDTDYFNDRLDGETRKLSYKRIHKDIRKVNEYDLEGVDFIIHLSALSNDPMGEIDPNLTLEINYQATINLAKIAKKVGVKRFIFSSSCSVYGIAKEDVVNEESEVNPLTSYAKSKILSESELKELADSNFCIGLLRNSTVYGFSPMFRNDLVVNNLVTCAIALKKIKIMSDGTPWRPLIDVRDLSKIFMEFLKAEDDKINGEIINIGFNNSNYQVKDIVSEISKQLPDCEIVYTGEHGKDSRSYRVNFDKFNRLFPHVHQDWPISLSIKDMIEKLSTVKFSPEDFNSGIYTRINTLKKLLSEKKLNDTLYWV